jgi:hypothetical protein
MKRFWDKAKKSEGCWEWTGCKQRTGYGRFRLAGWTQMAHRVAWELVHGLIPKGMQVLHRCDNPGCVNPNHLFLGTQTDNIYDMTAKGRHYRGERHKSAKLTESDVISIRMFDIPTRALSNLYGVNRASIRAIKRGEKWKHLANSIEQPGVDNGRR